MKIIQEMCFSVSHHITTGLNWVNYKGVQGFHKTELRGPSCDLKLFRFFMVLSPLTGSYSFSLFLVDLPLKSFLLARYSYFQNRYCHDKPMHGPIEPVTQCSQTYSIHDSNILDTPFSQLIILRSSDRGSGQMVLFVSEFRMCVCDM